MSLLGPPHVPKMELRTALGLEKPVFQEDIWVEGLYTSHWQTSINNVDPNEDVVPVL